MKATVKFTDNSTKFLRAVRKGKKQGLLAVARTVVRAVKRGLRGGYTSGDFVTGNVQNSVTYLAPYEIGDNEFETIVGTNVPYALHWELGHYNIFSRRQEPAQPVWQDALESVKEEIQQQYTAKISSALAELGR